jgi:hypothetical protein
VLLAAADHRPPCTGGHRAFLNQALDEVLQQAGLLPVVVGLQRCWVVEQLLLWNLLVDSLMLLHCHCRLLLSNVLDGVLQLLLPHGHLKP